MTIAAPAAFQTIIGAGCAGILVIKESSVDTGDTIISVGAVAGVAGLVAGLAVKGLDSGVNPDSLVDEVGTGVVEHMGVSGGEEDVVGNKDCANIVKFDGIC